MKLFKNDLIKWICMFLGMSIIGGTFTYIEYARIKKALVKPSEMKTVELDRNSNPMRVKRIFKQIGIIKYPFQKENNYSFIVDLVKKYSLDEICQNLDLTPKDLEPEIKKVLSIANEPYQIVIKELKTPLETAVYCRLVIENVYEADKSIYDQRDYFASFKRIHKKKGDDCDGGALASAAILNDDGFPPYLGILDPKKGRIGHAIFVYKTNDGKYNSIGKNESDYQTGCGTIEQLLQKINQDSGNDYVRTTVYDLSKRFSDFIDNERNNDPSV